MKIYEQVLTVGLKELKESLKDIVSEERKMHESIQKYKRDESGGTSSTSMSDFDKMLTQYYIVRIIFLAKLMMFRIY